MTTLGAAEAELTRLRALLASAEAERDALRDALTEAAAVLTYFIEDLRLEDEDGNCPAEVLCGDMACEENGCLIRKREIARTLSVEPK